MGGPANGTTKWLNADRNNTVTDELTNVGLTTTGGSSSPTQHRSAWQNFMAGFVGLSKPEVSAAMQEAGGMQTAQNFQHGIPLNMAPAAQAATDNVYDCTQFLVCAAGSMASGLIGTGGLAGGGDALLERGGMSATERLLLAEDEAAGALAKIGGPKEFDPDSLKGLTGDQVRSRIPSDWASGTSKSGGGEVFRDPANSGRQVRIMPGYGPGTRPDPLTTGPYAVVSQNGVTVKVPLFGNPTLP